MNYGFLAASIALDQRPPERRLSGTGTDSRTLPVSRLDHSGTNCCDETESLAFHEYQTLRQIRAENGTYGDMRTNNGPNACRSDRSYTDSPSAA